MTPVEVHSLTDSVSAWVQARSDLRALALVGSWARDAARPDSDLDLLILAQIPESYHSGQDWLSRIALPEPFRIVSRQGARYGVVWSCHVLLDPPGELELSFAALDWAATDPIDAGSRGVIRDGLRVIVDKDGALQRLVEAVKASE